MNKGSIYKDVKAASFLPLGIWFLILLVLVCLPGEDLPESDFLSGINFDKLVHAGLFGGIVFLFCWPFKKSSIERKEKVSLFLKATIATCIWGITTEFIQKFFVTGRQFDLLDWTADNLGAIIAFFVSKKLFS